MCGKNGIIGSVDVIEHRTVSVGPLTHQAFNDIHLRVGFGGGRTFGDQSRTIFVVHRPWAVELGRAHKPFRKLLPDRFVGRLSIRATREAYGGHDNRREQVAAAMR